MNVVCTEDEFLGYKCITCENEFMHSETKRITFDKNGYTAILIRGKYTSTKDINSDSYDLSIIDAKGNPVYIRKVFVEDNKYFKSNVPVEELKELLPIIAKANNKKKDNPVSDGKKIFSPLTLEEKKSFISAGFLID